MARWWKWSFAALLPVLLLAGCAAVGVQPTPSASRLSAAFVSAEELARKDASLTGQARQDNAAQIQRLLAGVDDATLARDAAALPAGDPLYNFAGRALLNRGLPLPRPFDRGSWHFDAGNRPPAESDGYRPPLKLGVLLPLSGEF
jgi:outer membrane PBP1 activator LpoA protein